MTSTTVDEVDIIQQVRQRTFSHWPHMIPSKAQMITAGFFSYSTDDRVICIYCNLICHRWTADTDEPCEVHKALSPKCSYVISRLINQNAALLSIVNENKMETTPQTHSTFSNELAPFYYDKFVHKIPCNLAYAELAKRITSFKTWPNENLLIVKDLARAGFFYTGIKTIITCFYCNGSLHNWDPENIPMIEHIRWFPHCTYAKEVCDGLWYRRKIQESKRIHRACDKTNESDSTNDNSDLNSTQLFIPDEDTLSCFVAARLNLPISKSLLNRDFHSSIIKRCWEDQLRLKQKDFATEYDLLISYLITKKYIEYIDEKKENIIIPKLWMNELKTKLEKQYVSNFIEDRTTTIQREHSLIHWHHLSPSRLNMMITGWFQIRTSSRDTTICLHCGILYDNWNTNTNPYFIHRQRSPLCPFIRSLHPIQLSAVSIQSAREAFTQQRINVDSNEPISNILSIPNSVYCRPCDRERTFLNFPNGYPPNVDALVRSGFYYTGINTSIQCYECRGIANDLHLRPSCEINNEHRHRFPRCRIAQLLIADHQMMLYNAIDRCKWCWKNVPEFLIDPCMHFVLCNSCTTLVNTCPICGIQAKSFIKIFK